MQPPSVDVNDKREAVTLLSMFTETLDWLLTLKEQEVERSLMTILESDQAKSNVKRAAVRSLLVIYSVAIIYGKDAFTSASYLRELPGQ